MICMSTWVVFCSCFDSTVTFSLQSCLKQVTQGMLSQVRVRVFFRSLSQLAECKGFVDVSSLLPTGHSPFPIKPAMSNRRASHGTCALENNVMRRILQLSPCYQISLANGDMMATGKGMCQRYGVISGKTGVTYGTKMNQTKLTEITKTIS